LGLGLLLLAGCAGGVKPRAVFTGRDAPQARELTVEIDSPQDGVSKIRLLGAGLQDAVVLGEARAVTKACSTALPFLPMTRSMWAISGPSPTSASPMRAFSK